LEDHVPGDADDDRNDEESDPPRYCLCGIYEMSKDAASLAYEKEISNRYDEGDKDLYPLGSSHWCAWGELLRMSPNY
jgi:hypothetical protein